MPSNTKVIITEDNSPAHWHTTVYRIDCSFCGLVDKAYTTDVVGRANTHNKYTHNNQAQVVVPETLTKGT